MSTRLSKGGRLIDRAKPLAFTFNGKPMRGFAGDTLASALLGGGQVMVGRSFKYHRPRGIVASGAEEPNALVGLGRLLSDRPLELLDGHLLRGAELHEPNIMAPHASSIAGVCGVDAQMDKET